MAESKSDILQGTLDLMVLQTLEAMGPLHGYGIARRIEQISEDVLQLNQGTIYASLLRLQQRRWISASWGTSENNRKAKFYAITRTGRKQLAAQAQNWERISAVMMRLLRLRRALTVSARALIGCERPCVPPRMRPRVPAGRPDDASSTPRSRRISICSPRTTSAAACRPRDARRHAILRFGGPVQIKEQQHENRGLPFVETTLQDLRYGLRALRKSPAYSLVAIATLAIGIGAGTSVFSVVGAVLMRPLPYSAPDQLVRIFETNPLRRWTRNIAALANYADWRTRNKSFTDIAAYEQFNANGSGAGDVFLTGFGEPQGLKALGVSGNLFQVLGARRCSAALSSKKNSGKDDRASPFSATGYGSRRLAAIRRIVGKTITLSGRGYEVVGVMPRAFFFPGRDVQLWTPFGYTPQLVAQSRRPHWLGVVARRRPGVSFEQARDDMSNIARQLEQQYPDTNTQMGVLLEPLHESYSSKPRAALLMLSGAVALLFLIVCANIANLQLGRGVSRTRELAIRRALGAGRGRVLRQLLTESLVLSVAGGALGFGLAVLAKAALTRYAASAIPLFAVVETDRTVLFFALGLSVIAPIIFGIAPALSTSRSEQVTERSESSSRADRIDAQRPRRGRSGAVDRPGRRRRAVGPQPRPAAGCGSGFAPEHAITFTMTLPSARYPDNAARYRDVPRDRAAAARAAGRAGGRRDQHARAARLYLDRRHDDRGARRHGLRARRAPHVDDHRLLQHDGHPPARRTAVRRRRYARQAAGDDRQRVAGAAVFPRAAERGRGRQACRVRPAAGQRALGHDRRRRRRREAGWTGSAGGADRVFEHRRSACRIR